MEPKKLKILLLEDSESDVTLIQRVLSRSGMVFEATVASDEQSFLSAIQNNVFDIILSDNYLPQFDAAGAIQLIRENRVDTPLILVTGTVSEGFAISMIKMGACDYILKDRLQRLPNAIWNAIERHTLKTKQQKEIDDLKKNETNLRAIFDNVETGCVLMGTNFNVILFNRSIYAFSKAYMAKPLETGSPIIDFFNPENREAAQAALHQASEGTAARYEMSCREQNGATKWFDMSFRPVKDDDQQITGIVLCETDITWIKEAELQKIQ